MNATNNDACACSTFRRHTGQVARRSRRVLVRWRSAPALRCLGDGAKQGRDLCWHHRVAECVQAFTPVRVYAPCDGARRLPGRWRFSRPGGPAGIVHPGGKFISISTHAALRDLGSACAAFSSWITRSESGRALR